MRKNFQKKHMLGDNYRLNADFISTFVTVACVALSVIMAIKKDWGFISFLIRTAVILISADVVLITIEHIFLYFYELTRYERALKKMPDFLLLPHHEQNILMHEEYKKWECPSIYNLSQKEAAQAHSRYVTMKYMLAREEVDKMESAMLEKQKEARKAEEEKKIIEAEKERIQNGDNAIDQGINKKILTFKGCVETMENERLAAAKEKATHLIDLCGRNMLALNSCERIFFIYIPEANVLLEKYEKMAKKNKELHEEKISNMITELEEALDYTSRQVQENSNEYFSEDVQMLIKTLKETKE